MCLPEATVKLVATDSSIMLSKKRVRVRGKETETPRCVLSITSSKMSEALAIQDSTTRGINELYRRLTKSKLHKMSRNNGEQMRFTRTMQNAVDKIESPNEINMIVLEYDNRTDEEKMSNIRQAQIPVVDEIQYLCDLIVAPYNDIVIPSIMPFLNGTRYLDFLHQFFEYIPSYYSGPVMGLIPGGLHRIEFPRIVDFYSEKEIRLFLMDMRGGTPENHYADINLVLRLLSQLEKESGEVCYLQGLNVSYGRPRTTTPVAPAKDILSVFLGFDSFGRSHIAPRLPPDLYERHPHPSSFRIFNRNDYGYYRSDVASPENFKDEERATINLIDLHSRPDRRNLARIFNVERHGIETSLVRDLIEEQDSLADYVRTKKHVEGRPLKQVLDLKGTVRDQLSLR